MSVSHATRALLLVAACDALSVRPALRVPASSCAPRHAALVMNVAANAAAINAVLAAQPEWEVGQAVTVNTVWERVVGGGSLSDDDFDDALDLLEERGTVRVEVGETDDDDDLLYNANVRVVPVVFDAERAERYDYEAEAEAAEGVVRAIRNLKLFGVDKDDAAWWGELGDACSRLAQATAESPAPVLRDDPRLIGDWELVRRPRQLTQHDGARC